MSINNNGVDVSELNEFLNNIISNIKERRYLEAHRNDNFIHLNSLEKGKLKESLDSIPPTGVKYNTHFIKQDNSKILEPDNIFKIGEFVSTPQQLSDAMIKTTYNKIYDLLNKKIYIRNDSSFILDSSLDIYNELGLGRLLYNGRTKNMFYIETNLDILVIILEDYNLLSVVERMLEKEKNLFDINSLVEVLKNLELYDNNVINHNHDNMYVKSSILTDNSYEKDLISSNNIYNIPGRRLVSESNITEWTESKIDATGMNDKLSNFYTELINNITEGVVGRIVKDRDIYDYINITNFKNLPNKVGYLDEKTIPIYATYNMSFAAYATPYKIITDFKGREIIYLLGSNGREEDPLRIYKAYRMNDLENYVFINTPLTPAHLPANEFPTHIYGLGNEYIIYYTNLSNTYLVRNNGDSDESKWTNDKVTNLTDMIASNNILNINTIQYYKKYNTLIFYYLDTSDNYKFGIKIYDLNAFNLINQTTYTFPVDYSDYEIFSGFSYRGGLHPSIIYNPVKNHLCIFAAYGGYTKLRDSAVVYQDKTLTQIFNVEETFFRDGSPELIPLIPVDKYNWKSGTGGIAVNSNGGGGVSVIYDEYENCIKASFCPQNSYYNYIYKTKAESRIYASISYITYDYDTYYSLTSPDICPWAKSINRPFFLHDGTLQFIGDSVSHGRSYICTEYDTTSLDEDGYIKFTPGRWWREPYSYSIDNILTTVIKTVDGVVYTKVDGHDTFSIDIQNFIGSDNVERKGKRVYSLLPRKIPDLNPNYSYKNFIYDSVRDIIYAIVADEIASEPLKQGWIYLTKYDDSTQTWVAYNGIPTYLVDYYTSLYNNRQTTVSASIGSNTFIDIDGNLYFSIDGATVGGTLASNVIKFNISTNEYTATNLNLVQYWGYKFIGWDKHFGYYTSTSSGLPRLGSIISTKSLNGGIERTFEEFMNGIYHISKIGLSSSVGLVAYLQNTPLFIGGYLTQLKKQEIALLPNTTNYIYLIRDKNDINRVKLVVKNKLISAEGQNGFNKILATKIITDSANVIYQEYYEV